ncbi:MAG: phosphatase PAP2 family protein [Endomicrobium sp.]|nr:phosphatase PAP2 family protein [Endomicrobium sp.]
MMKILRTLFIVIILLFCNIKVCHTYSNKTIIPQNLDNKNRINTLQNKIIQLDYMIFKFIHLNIKCKFLDYFIQLSNIIYSTVHFNYSLTMFIIIISIILIYKHSKKHFYSNLLNLFIVLLVSITINDIIKRMVCRLRPISIFGIDNMHTVLETKYTKSFPSGHTQLAFTICTFMLFLIRKCYVSYIFTSIIIGLERIYIGNHFPSDILGGAILGITTTYVTLLALSFIKKIIHRCM